MDIVGRVRTRHCWSKGNGGCDDSLKLRWSSSGCEARPARGEPARVGSEADIVSFFDSLDRTKLKEMLEVGVADGSLLRLIGKCLHVGVLDGAELSAPETGTAQGSVLSPLLGNVYLHHALDLWFEIEVKPRLPGQGNSTPVLRRLRHRLRARGRRAACDDGARQAAGALRTDPASGQDPAAALPASAGGPEERERFGLLRLPRVHALLGALSSGSLGDGVQDSAGEPETGDPVRHRLVPSPSAPSGPGSARGAHETIAGPLQLLRRERQLP